MNKKISIKLLVAALPLLFSGCTTEKSSSVELLVDADAKQIVEHIAGFQHEKPVLVNYWATWCAPCTEEFPYIMELKEKYGDKFELVFVSGDFREAKAEAREFLREQNVDFTTFYKVGNDNEFIDTISPTWSGALPFTMIYAKDGSVATQWEGKEEFEVFEKELLKVINAG